MSCYESRDVTGSAGRVTETPELLHVDDGGQIADMSEKSADCVRDSMEMSELEHDTREKLEADVRKHYAYSTTTLMYPPSANKTTDMLSALPVDTVIGWLDRQAAITERETLHSHPMCAGSDACPALNRPIGESVDNETPNTAGIGASKDEIRDFDVWNVAYEIYCAGGYVDNGNEPNPPTDGIRELLERQAAITGREMEDAFLDRADIIITRREKEKRDLQQQVNDLKAERDAWKDAHEDSERLRLELVKDLEHARRWSDKWRDLVHRYEGLCDGLLNERDRLRGEER